ncbi:MAG: Do family serine endopeptidase [Candidatus Omnitrophota bacterium]
MRNKLIILTVISFFSLSLYAQDYKNLEDATIQVAGDVGKAVVSITAIIKERSYRGFGFNSPLGGAEDDAFRRFFEDFFGNIPEEFGRAALGSGFIIDKDGYILTNAHVVGDAKEIKVTLSDGREFNAVLKGQDKQSELAVIKIDARDITPAKLGDSDKLKIGQFVLALGNPFGISIESRNSEPTITLGVVSALHRYLPAMSQRGGFEDLIQTDAAINPGNSGGPLVNLAGEVIGVNVAIITRSGGYEGIGFAIPANKAKRILARLIKGEKILYGWLGVSIQDLNQDLRNYFGVKEKEGVIVVKVFKDSPSEQAGIKEGDLILSFDSKPVTNTNELISLVNSAEVGIKVPLEVLRGGKDVMLNIKIGAKPEEIEKIETVEVTSFRGLEVEDLTPYLKQRFRIREEEGVVIVNIKENSPAEQSGLNVGDFIIRIGDKRIRDKKDFEKAVLGVKEKCLIKTNRGYFVLKEE